MNNIVIKSTWTDTRFRCWLKTRDVYMFWLAANDESIKPRDHKLWRSERERERDKKYSINLEKDRKVNNKAKALKTNTINRQYGAMLNNNR